MNSTPIDVAEAERLAAEATATAVQAREDADRRRKAANAARGRADYAWQDANSYRDTESRRRLTEAWDELVNKLAADTSDIVGLWAEFMTVRGQASATAETFGRTLPERWTGPNAPTVLDALVAAATQRGNQAAAQADADTTDLLEGEREAACQAAVAALSVDATATPVACFAYERRAWSTGDPWDGTTVSFSSDLEHGPSGVAKAYTALVAQQVRNFAKLSSAPIREITDAEAARIEHAYEHGEAGDLARDPQRQGSADEQAEQDSRLGAARALDRDRIRKLTGR